MLAHARRGHRRACARPPGSDTFDLTLVAAGDPSPLLESIIPAPGPREVIEQTRAGCAVDDVACRAGVAPHRCAECARRRGGEPAGRLGERDAPAGPRTDCERARDRSQVPGTGDPHAEAGRRARPGGRRARRAERREHHQGERPGARRVAARRRGIDDRDRRGPAGRCSTPAPGARSVGAARSRTSRLPFRHDIVARSASADGAAARGHQVAVRIRSRRHRRHSRRSGEDPESARRRSSLRRSFATSTTSSPARCSSPTTRRRFGAKPR